MEIEELPEKSILVEREIDQKIGEVRTSSLDISFGELISLHSKDPREILIQPEYQRLFRWSESQRSRFVESILLELPIPPLFVVENEDGILELIDGLQRVSSLLHFVDHTLIEPEEVRQQVAPEPLRLTGCDLIPSLNSLTYTEMSLRLKLTLKRSAVRVIIIKRPSTHILRYEMFKRLNSGGSELSAQEIRNCTSRMIGKDGADFYEFLVECTHFEAFQNTVSSLADATREKKGEEELVLRFFAAKNYTEFFRGSVTDWLDDYMENIMLGKLKFDYVKEKSIFEDTFSFLSKAFGADSFVKYRSGRPVGGLAPAYFEAVSIGVIPLLQSLDNAKFECLKIDLAKCVESGEFRSVTGPGANSKEKLKKRIDLLTQALGK